MQVHCNEGVAIRIGPEPCVGIREDDGEASAGERIGQPSSREKLKVPGADVFEITEGDMDGRVIASARPVRRGRRPWTLRDTLVKIGAKMVQHGRSITCQMAEAVTSKRVEGGAKPSLRPPSRITMSGL